MQRNLAIDEYASFWKALSPRRHRQVILLFLLSVLAALAEVGNLGILLPFLKAIANPESFLKSLGLFENLLSAWNRDSVILGLGVTFLAVVTLSAVLRAVTTYGHLKLTALLGADIGEQVLARILDRPYSWHLLQNSSETVGLITKDIDLVVQSIYAVLALFINGIIAILICITLFSISPSIMLNMSIVLGIFYWIVYRQTRAQLKIDGKVQSVSYSKSVQMTQEAVGGIRDILIDRTQSYYINRFDKENRSYRLAAGRINYKAQIPRYLIENFAMALIAIIVVFLSLKGEEIDSILPVLGGITLGSYRLLQPVQQCFNSVAYLQANSDPWEKVKLYLDQASLYTHNIFVHEISTASSKNPPYIQLKNIGFQYQDSSPWVLKDLSLSIPSGSCIGFVGGTGSGKSTTIDVILGLLKPQQGQVIIDGFDLHANKKNLDSWHQTIAHVPQQIFLTDGSFAENIAFGIPKAMIDIERVINAAKRAHIHDLIISQPNGYEQLVGERGIRLSGGQRQRIGIARALYKQAKVLILDEATSALDNHTESEIMHSLKCQSKNATKIMIAHRISTLKDCDCIYLLNEGKVAAKGSYHELITNSEEFRRLTKIIGTTERLSA